MTHEEQTDRITLNEAADIAGVSRRTVERSLSETADPRLESVLTEDGRRLVSRADVSEWASERKRQGLTATRSRRDREVSWLRERLEAAEETIASLTTTVGEQCSRLLALPSPAEVDELQQQAESAGNVARERDQATEEARAAKDDIGKLESELDEEAAARRTAEENAAAERERAEKLKKRARELKAELEAERARSWWRRLWGR